MKAFLRLSFLWVTIGSVMNGNSQEIEIDWALQQNIAIDSLHGQIAVLSRTESPRRIALGNENIRTIYEACSRAPIAIVTNHTGVLKADVGRMPAIHLVDTLLALGIDIRKVFAPEHGFRGDAHNGADIPHGTDLETGLPLVSLHGQHRKPTPNMLADIRIILFDLQDVGTRFYTYLSTLFLVMEAASESGDVVIVLDRPNPNGHQRAGPMLDPAWTSFVGQVPVPMVHGMTLGEIALMINGEGWLAEGKTCELLVIPCIGYAHSDRWFPTIAPSPNLPSAASIALYPSLCLFEPTEASIGRGTIHPFECVGFPEMPSGTFAFTPKPMPGAAPNPKHKGLLCSGQNLRPLAEAWMEGNGGFDLSLLEGYYTQWNEVYPSQPFVRNPSNFHRLAGSASVLQALESGHLTQGLTQQWLGPLIQFHEQSQPYLLYPWQRTR